MKKRVLHVISSELCVSGVPTVVMQIVRTLKDKYTFDIVTISEQAGYYDEEFESYGGKIHRVHVVSYGGIKRLVYPYRFIQIGRRIRKILSENKYDIIHTHAGCDDWPVIMEAKKAGVPVRISHSHSDYSAPWTNKIVQYTNLIAKRSISHNVTEALACSDVAGSSLFLKRDYKKILNPIDTAYYSHIEKTPHTGINLLQIGYFCRNKNQLFSIEVLHKLRLEGIDAHIIFIGYTHEKDYYNEMLNRMKMLGVEEYVAFMEKDTEKNEVFPCVDYILLPSENEGLPLVALEGQTAGIPCILSDSISRDADIGAACFAKFNDTDAWVDCIKSGVKVDSERIEKTCAKISTEAYTEIIKQFYSKKAQ